MKEQQKTTQSREAKKLHKRYSGTLAANIKMFKGLVSCNRERFCEEIG
jgi:hypothetical protein